MAGECCKLVGDLNLNFEGCIISINTTCNTEAIVACGEENPLPGATTGTLNITSYANDQLWVGCPSRAGLNVNYVRKYDCINDIVYFISSGQGQSFTYGDVGSIVRVKYELYTCSALSANSSSGPASIYTDSPQTNGYGLVYIGGPISIDTTPTMLPIRIDSLVESDLYLQSFSFEAQPGQFPTATYSFAYALGGY